MRKSPVLAVLIASIGAVLAQPVSHNFDTNPVAKVEWGRSADGKRLVWRFTSKWGSPLVLASSSDFFRRGHFVKSAFQGTLTSIWLIDDKGVEHKLPKITLLVRFNANDANKKQTMLIEAEANGRAKWWISPPKVDQLGLFSPRCVDSPSGEPECNLEDGVFTVPEFVVKDIDYIPVAARFEFAL